MTKNRTDWLIISSALLLFVSLPGCDSTQMHRARQYNQVFNDMPVDMQLSSLNGHVREGDTPEAVYIAMGKPQSIEKIKKLDGVYEDHWIYLGNPAPESQILAPGNHHYITVNDFVWSNPFDDEATQRIAIVFKGDYLDRIEVENDTGDPLNMAFPSIVLPEGQPASIANEPSLAN
ncbi:hypothetical protein [Rubellicoccus peritrichatus]|uniref:Uncharacterized protein n=1 Tax=Rubellicoccus peritrichatus TaxID=3080537 RepID=A0AAQ3L8S4_9BACT|nr:hypothetical protein [Puniceicoccus sp. CR14]WOO39787.1 hypothetical protein RZN69_14275 [Puniceicoccus sp. CR14]